MPRTKADRSAAAKKGAATRERNKIKKRSQARGTKAAASRQGNAAAESLNQAKRGVGAAVGGVRSAAEAAGKAAKEAGKSAVTRARGSSKR